MVAISYPRVWVFNPVLWRRSGVWGQSHRDTLQWWYAGILGFGSLGFRLYNSALFPLPRVRSMAGFKMLSTFFLTMPYSCAWCFNFLYSSSKAFLRSVSWLYWLGAWQGSGASHRCQRVCVMHGRRLHGVSPRFDVHGGMRPRSWRFSSRRIRAWFVDTWIYASLAPPCL